MKKVILQLHLWVGLTAALLLLVLGVTGAMLVFEDQIDHWLNPQLSYVVPSGAPLPLSTLEQAAGKAHPGYQVEGVFFPGSADLSYGIDLASNSGDGIEIAVNQYTGEILGTWDDNRFVRKLHGLHTHLLGGKVGQAIVGWGGGVFLLFLSLTGLILWWPRKLGTFRWSSFGTKFQFDLHNTIGIYASAFVLIFAITGIAIHWEGEVRELAKRISPTPAQQIKAKGTITPGKTLLTIDQLYASAQNAVPGARVTGIGLPNDATSPARVAMRFPEDHTPAGRTRLLLDPYSGKVLSLVNTREMPWAVSYAARVNRELHTGDIFGWPSKIAAALFSLALPVLAVTGPLIWWNRKMAARRAHSRKQAVAA